MTKDEVLKLALSTLNEVRSETFRLMRNGQKLYAEKKVWDTITTIKQALEQPEKEPVTVLPDGSAFAVMSYPLPKDHWLYAERQYNDGEHEPVELGKAILTHEMRDAVVSAVRYAIRSATNCGKENDFDPDALVQNAVYALCGPYKSPPKREPLTDEQVKAIVQNEGFLSLQHFARAIEQAHGIGEKK